MRDLAILIILPCLIYFAFRKPVIALGLWLWTSAFNINAFFYGFATSIIFTKVFAAITMLSYVFCKEKGPVKFESVSILVIIFFLVATISNLYAIGNIAFAWERWGFYFKVVLFYVFAIAIVNKKIHFDFLIWILIISIGALAATEGLKFLVSGGGHRIGDLRGISGDNNFFGVMIVTIIPLTYYIFTQTTDKLLKLGVMGILCFMILGVFSTYSRGAFLGLSVFAFFFWKSSDKKLFWLLLLFVVVFSINSFMPDAWLSRMDTIESADSDSSFMGRVVAWKLATLIAMDNFWGGGFRAIQTFSVWQLYSLEFDTLDFIPTPYPDENSPHAYHSMYFQVLGNHGFLGLFLFINILLAIYFKLSRIQKVAKKNDPESWVVVLSRMLKISLMSYCVSGAAVNVAYLDLGYMIFAFTIALDKRNYNDRLTTHP